MIRVAFPDSPLTTLEDDRNQSRIREYNLGMSTDHEKRLLAASKRFFGSGYYRDPEPRIAADALEFVLAGPGPQPDHVLLMFSQAARRYDGIRLEFDSLRARVPFIADAVGRILATAADASFPDLLKEPLVGPVVLDYLWGEFFLSGAEAPVRRIAGVLEWEDKILTAAIEWVGERVFLPRSRRKKAEKISSLNRHGISFDTRQARLGNLFDLDLVVWKLMSGGFKIRAELPFTVSDSLLLHMAIKGAACWSIQSNAVSHPIVHAIYAGVPNSERLPRFA